MSSFAHALTLFDENEIKKVTRLPAGPERRPPGSHSASGPSVVQP